MNHSADGKLRFSPRDLVAYLEGDFAAWCERMLAERGRNGGAGSSELEWATPDEDEERELAALKGQEYEHRYLGLVRERHPGLVEIEFEDPAGPELTLSAMRDGAPVIYQAHLAVRRLARLPRLSLSAASATPAPAAATTTPLGTPSSPAPPSRTS